MSKQPTFTVVVPTYDRLARLAECVRGLTRLDYPRDRLEVIVVDDGSPVPVAETVAQVAAGIDVRVVARANAGPASARNHGASAARGELVAFTDDDCVPAPNWLTVLAERLLDRPEDAVGGRTVNVLRANPYSSASQLIVDLVYAHYNASPDQATFVASNNLAMSTERFRALGGFDESFGAAGGEDRDFCARWLARGWQLRYAREAVVQHAHALDLRGFLRQHFNYGRGAKRYHWGGPRDGSRPLRRDLRFHRSLPFGARRALADADRGMRARIAALLVAFEAANAAGYAWEWLRSE